MRHVNKVLVALIVAALPVAYFGAYLALVSERDEYGAYCVEGSTDGSSFEGWVPHYGFGGDMARTIFRPAHQLDVRFRPEFWGMPDSPTLWGTPDSRAQRAASRGSGGGE